MTEPARDVVERLALEHSFECEWFNGRKNPPTDWAFQKDELAAFASALLLWAADLLEAESVSIHQQWKAAGKSCKHLEGRSDGIDEAAALLKTKAGELK